MDGNALLAGSDSCTLKSGRLVRRACGAPASGWCVYCGEPFCDAHGEHGADYLQVCSRTECATKQRDVDAHREWVRTNYVRSRAGICVADDCREPNEHECQRCRLRFCPDHLRVGTVTEHSTGGPQRVTMMLCPHCLARRKLWD
ncbi:MAG: hypothetical protein AMXMBFR23_24160 [Chloroflexota bacterium]